MNERLEKEICEEKKMLGPLLTPITNAALTEYALHFYQFALKEVKEEIESRACPEHGTFIDTIIDFIEKLQNYG